MYKMLFGLFVVIALARNEDKVASALSLDLVSKLVTARDCGIEDLLEVVEGNTYSSEQPCPFYL